MQDLVRIAFTTQCLRLEDAKPRNKKTRKVMAAHRINHKTPIHRIAVFFGLLISTFFWLIAFRFVSLPFLIAAWVFVLKFERDSCRPALIAWIVWLTLTFSPIDILPIRKGGRPRLVPLVMGLPTRETVQRAKRGEVILGGCIVSGFEPKYYFVW